MNILITGGAGFIGSQIGYGLQELGHKITLLDNLSYGHRDNLNHKGIQIGKFIEGDVRDRTIGNLLDNVDAVIHMAGIAPLPDCQIDPQSAIENNVLGTANMLDLCRKAGVSTFIFASTSAIYENCSETPFREDNVEKEPDLIYAVTKRQCEIICQAYSTIYGMDTISLRFFNVYGPHQDFRRKHPPLMGYISKCLLDNTQPTFYSSGDQKRDYLSGNAFNVATQESYSVREIYSEFCKQFGKTIEPRFENANAFWDKYPEMFNGPFPMKKERVEKEGNKFSLGSSEKCERVLGWKPTTSLSEGIKSVVQYCKEISESEK